MADVHPLHSALHQEEPYVTVQPAGLDVGEQFHDGAIRTRNYSRPPMCLRYGYLMAEDPSPDNAASEEQVLDGEERVLERNEVEVEIVDEDESGGLVFEIKFSQDNQYYLVQLAFGPQERSDDEDSPQEDGDEGSDRYSDDEEDRALEEDESDDEEETYEGEESDEGDLTGKRDFELYFPHGDRYYVVRLVFENEVFSFVEEGDESLFGGLQRLVEISYYDRLASQGTLKSEREDEDEVPAIDDSDYAESKPAVPEISRNCTEEDGEKRNGIECLETGKGSENEIDADRLMKLERQNDHHLELHSPLAQPAPLPTSITASVCPELI